MGSPSHKFCPKFLALLKVQHSINFGHPQPQILSQILTTIKGTTFHQFWAHLVSIFAQNSKSKGSYYTPSMLCTSSLKSRPKFLALLKVLISINFGHLQPQILPQILSTIEGTVFHQFWAAPASNFVPNSYYCTIEGTTFHQFCLWPQILP